MKNHRSVKKFDGIGSAQIWHWRSYLESKMNSMKKSHDPKD